MGLKVYDSGWNQAKALKIYNGATWTNAIKGWIWDGSNWKINYPEAPFFSTSPSISYISTQQPIPGSGLIVNNGTTSTDPAYLATSYTYQWVRSGSPIPGANSNTYYLTDSDVGYLVSCIVTATNARGSTPGQASNFFQVLPGAPTNLTITDNTATPTTPGSVSVSTSANAWSANWGASSSVSYYSVSSNNGSVTSQSGTSASSNNASPGSVTVYVTAVNLSVSGRISWSPGPGATSYDVSYPNGTVNTTNTYLDITNQTGTFLVTVTSKNGGTTGYAAQTNGSINTKQSGTATGSGTVPSPPGTPSPTTSSVTSSSFTISWGATSNTDSYSVYVGTYSGGANIVNASTAGTSYPVSGLSGNTTYYVTVTGYGNAYAGYGSSGYTSATTLVAFVTPTIGTPNVNFERYSVSGTNQGMKWGWDNVSWSGSVAEPAWMEWEIYTTSSGGSYGWYGLPTYYAGQRTSPLVNGFTWSYLVYTTRDLPYSTSARYLRARMVVYDTNYTLRYGPWSARV